MSPSAVCGESTLADAGIENSDALEDSLQVKFFFHIKKKGNLCVSEPSLALLEKEIKFLSC